MGITPLTFGNVEISNGSQRGLAAFLVLMALPGPHLLFGGRGCDIKLARPPALIFMARCDLADGPDYCDDWQSEPVTALLESLFHIPVKCTEEVDAVSDLVASAALQNQNAQVTPLSAVQWAQLLKKIDAGSYDVAIARYNDHPLVIAYKSASRDAGSDSDDDRGMVFGKSKINLVKHLMEHCADGVFQLILDHLDDNQWKFSAFTERMLQLPALWLGSTAEVPMAAMRQTDGGTPAVGEVVELQSRPLTPKSQLRLFNRIIQDRLFNCSNALKAA
jgi:hypothetical protein